MRHSWTLVLSQARQLPAITTGLPRQLPRAGAGVLSWLAVYFSLVLCLLAHLPYQDALRYPHVSVVGITG
jgi:hypothetical protein